MNNSYQQNLWKIALRVSNLRVARALMPIVRRQMRFLSIRAELTIDVDPTPKVHRVFRRALTLEETAFRRKVVMLMCTVADRISERSNLALRRALKRRRRTHALSRSTALAISSVSTLVGLGILYTARHSPPTSLAYHMGLASLILGIGTSVYQTFTDLSQALAERHNGYHQLLVELTQAHFDVEIWEFGHVAEVTYQFSPDDSDSDAVRHFEAILHSG